jgi:GNAT superfamily N-acetyltransferase
MHGFLIVENAGALAVMPRIPLPHGLESTFVRNRRFHNWQLFRESHRGLDRLVAVDVDPQTEQPRVDQWTSRAIEIYIPTGPWIVPAQSRRPALTFSLAAKGPELVEAKELLRRSHPLGPPRAGMVLTCKYTHAEEQRSVLQGSSGVDPTSAAWDKDPGGIVGCLVIGVLYHGNPTGRLHLIRDYGMTEEYYYAPRDQVVRRLGIAWISRVAVDAPYHGHAIGTALVAEARTIVAPQHFPTQPRFLEVIRSVRADKAHSLVVNQEASDFITRGGFNRAPELLPSRRLPKANGGTEGDLWEANWMRKLYYYAETGGHR